MNTENPQDVENQEIMAVMDWAWEVGDLIPALRMLMFADSMEVGGPDLILPVPSRGYSALLIWLHDGEMSDDQERWLDDYAWLVESSNGSAMYRTHFSDNHQAAVRAIRKYLQPDFDAEPVH